ncbi:MAG: PD-(D/E)XK nuclease family protein [Armatimonadetes bacterium]|nr:PD-(D/E)XK nuclease family protein [Armatimonadota bacterium]
MEFRISAKNLGALALPGFCPRCGWIKLRLGSKLPFQIFPGIFSSIDSYTKKVVHGTFDTTGAFPPYIERLGAIARYVDPPHYTKFKRLDPMSGVLIWGTPDAILQLKDGSYVIADYKTARYTKHADSLAPMYDVQLNSYAFIGEENGVSPVSSLALLYFEPETTEENAISKESAMEHGFRMGFRCTIKPVERDPSLVTGLLQMAADLMRLDSPREGRDGCKDCAKLDGLLKVAGD